MTSKSTTVTLLVLAIAGVLFSGYLSYYTLWGPGCTKAIVSCGAKPVEILGLPQCIYGFFMFFILMVLAIAAMVREQKRGLLKAIMAFGILGTAFAGFLSVYELFIIDTGVSALPGCVYGFFIYVAILIFSVAGLRKPAEIIPPTPSV